MIAPEFDANGDSQIFKAHDGSNFIIRRVRRLTQTLNRTVDPETVPYTYFLVCENGRPLSGGLTEEGAITAAAKRMTPPNLETLSDDEYNKLTNFGAF